MPCGGCGTKETERCPVCSARWCRDCLVEVSAEVSSGVVYRGVRCRLCGHEWKVASQDRGPTLTDQEVSNMANANDPRNRPQTQTDPNVPLRAPAPNPDPNAPVAPSSDDEKALREAEAKDAERRAEAERRKDEERR